MATGWLFGYGDGHRVTEDEVRHRLEQVPLMVGFGGGVNSTAMVIEMVRREIRPDVILLADTGNEWPETYEAIAKILWWMTRHGLNFRVVKRHSPETGDRSLEENCLRLKTLPSRAFGLSSCAFKWKIEAQEQWVKATGFGKGCPHIIKALGYDAGEDYRATIHEKDGYRYWYPLQEWALDRDDCIRLIEAEGLPVPPKSACFFCPSSKPAEVVKLAAEHPDLFKRAVAMERRFIAAQEEEGGTGSVVGLGRHWTWEGVVRLSEEARAKLPAPAPGCLVCSEDTCDNSFEGWL